MHTYLTTNYASLYDLDTHEQRAQTWPELCAAFAIYQRVHRKDLAAGFGPYALGPPHLACYHHRDGVRRDGPHRCDRCVTAITLAVFDVDLGDRAACEALLEAAGVARLWYSSYSYDPVQRPHAFRLVLPLEQPCPPENWPELRAFLITRFAIPADGDKCSGLSHFYFVPSCPGWIEPVVEARDGKPLDWTLFGLRPVRRVPTAYVPAQFDPPAEPTKPVELGALRAALAHKAATLKRNPALAHKSELIANCLAGKPLAAHGSRNQSTLVLAGIVAFALPGQALSTLWRLLEASVEAMIADGSTLNRTEVERMLLSSMADKHAHDEAKTRRVFQRQEANAKLPVVVL